jgi:hypothetical protein
MIYSYLRPFIEDASLSSICYKMNVETSGKALGSEGQAFEEWEAHTTCLIRRAFPSHQSQGWGLYASTLLSVVLGVP